MEKEMLAGLLDHAEWIVFALILANQAGIPVFAAPALLAVGALAWTGDVNVAIAIAGAMGASLCADLGWYTVGRWHGHWALAALGRLSRETGTLVDDAQRLFLAHDRAFQLGARFLPELNPVAATFAGVAGVSLKRFLAGATVTAAVWAGTWIGVGSLIASTTWSTGGSGLPLFTVIMAASMIASLSVVIRPAVGPSRRLRGRCEPWFHRDRPSRPRTPPRSAETGSRDADFARRSDRHRAVRRPIRGARVGQPARAAAAGGPGTSGSRDRLHP